MNKKSSFSSYVVVAIIILIFEAVLALFTGKGFSIGFVFLETLPFWVYLIVRKMNGNAPTIILIIFIVVFTVIVFRERIVYYFRVGVGELIPMSIRIVLQCFSYIVANSTARD